MYVIKRLHTILLYLLEQNRYINARMLLNTQVYYCIVRVCNNNRDLLDVCAWSLDDDFARFASVLIDR